MKFPCGKQWLGYSLYRSLDSSDTQPVSTRNPNSTRLDWGNSTLGQGNSNSTEEGSVHEGYYINLQELEANDSRIVGGQLQKQGGSPWQVTNWVVIKLPNVNICGR